MKPTHTHHNTFTIDRTFKHSPERVFNAFATPEGKAKWFAGPNGWTPEIREFEFKVGGKERVRGRFPNGGSSDFRCTYYDIVPNERIVYVYDMYANEEWLSTSLATIELLKTSGGTQMRFTEQGVYYRAEGKADAEGREQGSRFLIEAVDQALSR